MSTPRHSGSKPRIPFNNRPTANRWTHVPLLRPALDRPLTVVAIGHVAMGVDLHFDGQNSIPCGGGPLGCKQCEERRSRRRTWFVQVATLPALKVGILVITDGAWRSCPRLHDQETSLRGHYIKAWRTGRVVNGPMHVEIGKHCGSDQLPPGVDLEAALAHIWGLDDLSDS